MEMYSDEGDIQRCVQTAIRVAAYQYADYTEMSVRNYIFPVNLNIVDLFSFSFSFTFQYPTQIARAFFKLGQIHGHAKISFTLLSMGLPEAILKIMNSYLQYGKNFGVEGCDF